jgi:hypothetical protein
MMLAAVYPLGPITMTMAALSILVKRGTSREKYEHRDKKK